jgi:exopolyphosphatase/guanosine-5'-triphosphate,3'-diphosphate pyrophosphatase
MMACGLDIGSNTFSFTEMRRGDHGIEVVYDTSIPVRLSEGLTHGGELKPAAVMRGLAAVESLCKSHDLRHKPLRVVGTAALRMTCNPARFTEPAAEMLGSVVEILSGEDEARLVRLGALFQLTGKGPWVVVDVGGQSTELSWVEDDQVQAVSLPVGVVGLTGTHLASHPISAAQVTALREEVASIAGGMLPVDLPGTVLAVAGTATTLGSIELNLAGWQRDKVHGLGLNRARLQHWFTQMRVLTPADRTARYGVGKGRADVFPAGLLLIDTLLEYLGRSAFTVSVNGLRVGAALSLLNKGR